MYLPPLSSKLFERFLYESMFSFFAENSLMSQNESGLKLGNTCTNQLLIIKHQIQKAFENDHKVRSASLHVFKVFAKV